LAALRFVEFSDWTLFCIVKNLALKSIDLTSAQSIATVRGVFA
jgi:hypothetical protein